MELTRKRFLASAAAFSAATGVDLAASAESVRTENPFRAKDYEYFRKVLKAFFPPGYCRKECQDPLQVASAKTIRSAMIAWSDAHPDSDALDARRESYMLMRKHFYPILFPDSPFYCECGINGGWSGARPGLSVFAVCYKFYKERGLVPDEAFALLKARSKAHMTLCCGPFVDNAHHVPPFRTIFKKGFAGVRADVVAALEKCPADDHLGRKELETAIVGLDTLHELQLAFAKKAEAMLAAGGLNEAQRKNMMRIAEAARRCPWEPPQTFFEGLNALWFIREVLGYVDGLLNQALGHPDAWCIDLYRADLAAGRITEAEMRDLVAKFVIYADCHESGAVPVDSYDDQEVEIQLTLGGCHPDGKLVWNELTKAFLDAHIGCDCVYPKLFCRFSSKSPEDYLRKIGAMIIKGHSVFTLLNDDRHIANSLAYGFDIAEARDYVGGGCWEGYIDSATDVDDCNYVSLMKLLEMTIHRDIELEKSAKVTIDMIDNARSFEEVKSIVMRNIVRFFRSLISYATRYGATGAKVFPHPVYTMCLDGGVETRRDTTEGGVRFRPKVYTLAFLGSFVDSLAAIRQLCFVDRTCTLKELLAAVRSNWEGAEGERLRYAVLAAPYWGDNSPVSNELAAWTVRSVYEGIEGMSSEHCGPIVLDVYVYREFMYWGNEMKATPDGRRNGDRLSQGMSPSEFRCKEGATSVINAIGHVPHELIYQSNTNLTFEPSAVTPEIFASIFRVYAKKGAHEIQPNCTSVEQLLEAQKDPERYQYLIVRVCGFSARFTHLSKRWQDEVIARHRLR
ncbi:MAG: hypothetical protein IKO72_07845 [Kiritimatiellae bacterium]|nr:hypothetical protein [Kiritimatiellia bacterium]